MPEGKYMAEYNLEKYKGKVVTFPDIEVEDPRLYDTYDLSFTDSLEKRLKETGVIPNFTDNAETILRKRYYKKDERGRTLENGQDLIARVAANVAYADRHYNIDDETVYETAKTFYNMMARMEFMPNSPTLMNAGRKTSNDSRGMQQLSACFFLPVEDDMDSIVDRIADAARIHKSGGGTGFSFSRLRRRNSYVSTTYGKASGPLSFIGGYDGVTNAVNQGGTRRGANMGSLRVDHPDVIEFIHAKEEEGKFKNFNFSVEITDEFIDAVLKGNNFGYYALKKDVIAGDLLTKEDLLQDRYNVKEGIITESELSLKLSEDNKKILDPFTGREIGVIGKGDVAYLHAPTVLEEIANSAWEKGEPGIFFIDRINKYNPTPSIAKIEGTNPCGEQPLLPYEACNLGSINLEKMIHNKRVDETKLRESVQNAVHFLDNVVDMSKFPLEKITKMVRLNRKIGLGVMGFANMLVQLEIPYNSEEAIETARKVMSIIQEESKKVSYKLAKERGVFPAFELSIYNDGDEKHKYRNAATTTIAPTGSVGIIAGASPGIEPNFGLAFTHTDAEGHKKLFKNEYLVESLRKEGFNNEKISTIMDGLTRGESLQDMEEIPENIKKIYIISRDISPGYHLGVQAAFQENVDNAVSKTLNLPNNITQKEVLEIYKKAYELGCKGVTVYREGSRDIEVLKTGESLEHKLLKVERHSRLKEAEDADKYSIETGEGTLHVTIGGNEVGFPLEVFENLGPIGTSKSTSAAVDGLRISRYLQEVKEPDLLKILKDYGSAKSDSPIGFGPNRVDSLQHGFSIIWRYHLLRHGILEQDGEIGLKQVIFKNETNEKSKEPEYNKEVKKIEYSGLACPSCGSRNTYLAEGCRDPICLDCGENKCN